MLHVVRYLEPFELGSGELPLVPHSLPSAVQSTESPPLEVPMAYPSQFLTDILESDSSCLCESRREMFQLCCREKGTKCADSEALPDCDCAAC